MGLLPADRDVSARSNARRAAAVSKGSGRGSPIRSTARFMASVETLA